jgi:hypothetical protein
MQARDPTDLTPSLTEYVFTSSGSHQARSSTLAEPDRFFVVDANMSRRGFPASGQRRRDYLEFICGGDRRLDTQLGQEILLDTLPEQRVLD